MPAAQVRDSFSPRSLQGKVAFVTGGGQGLGAAICRALSAAGAQVVVADLRLERARAVTADLGGTCSAAQVDVGDEGQVRQALEQAAARHGSLDILVNNAGIDFTLALEELSAEQWDAVIRTNLRGPFLASKHAAAIMRRQAEGGQGPDACKGHIVNIASTAAKRAWPNASAYHASKWGLLGFSHALHAELRLQGIKVSAVVAGGMRTPFLLDRFPDLDPGVLQDPANVAATIVFLLMQPAETVIPEVMVIPMRESSWP
jgi:NAD(P)-dependent dehydrogenase (short-subunit alcohol dehydrogenase family)